MSGLFGSKPKMPAPAPVVPTVATPAVQAASDAQRMKARAASGRAATMLTSTEEQAQTPMTATKKLLGGWRVASLYITEFQASGNSESGAQLQVGMQPAVAMQKLSFSTSTQSAEFDDRTLFIRLHTDADCHIVFGTNPTATTNHMPMLAGSTEYFGAITPGLKLAVIAA